MTYSSRNFLISWGVGSDDRVPRFSNRLSSAMMSLQTSTHSSQMKTVGPAISFRTSFWSLLQNEQRRTSPSPFFLTIGSIRRAGRQPRGPRADRTVRATPALRSFTDDIVNNTVFLALLGAHDVVPLGIILDTLERLSRVLRQYLVEPLTCAQQLAGVDVDIRRLAAQPLHPRLVNEDAGIRQRVPLALRSRGQQHRRHRRRLTDAVGPHVRFDELHRAIARHHR